MNLTEMAMNSWPASICILVELGRMGRALAIAGLLPIMRFQHFARRFQRLRRPEKIARDERDLGLGNHATRPRQRLARAEGARSTLQQRLGADEIAELRHGDAAQR